MIQLSGMHRITLALLLSFGVASAALSSLSAPLSAAAQIVPGVSEPITLVLSPDIPKPNGEFTVRAQSFSVDLDSALISWSIDGKETQRGVGLKELSARAGGAGTMSTITASIATVGAGTFTQSVVIRPADVALMWETDTYTPPFYKGKALHSFNGSFKVLALPEFFDLAGRRINPRELVYSWSKNGEPIASASGYGKTTFISSQTSYLRPGEEITVEVSAPRDNIVARRSITISPVAPKTVFYEQSPLYGTIYENSLARGVSLTNEEVSVVAEPYFFSVPTRDSADLSYSWKLNGVALKSSQDKSDITLRKAGEAGTSNLSIAVQNRAKVLQGANASIIIQHE